MTNPLSLLPGNLTSILHVTAETTCPPFWDQAPYRHFTNHGTLHSQRVLQKALELTDLLPNSQRLTIHELFLLSTSAYLYEIGMQSPRLRPTLEFEYRPGDLLTFVQLEQIRARKHLLTERLILESVSGGPNTPVLPLSFIPNDYIRVVAEICRGCSDEGIDQAVEVRPIRGTPARVRLLVALLRLADQLYFDPSRVNLDILQRTGLPIDRLVRWWSYHYVQTLPIVNNLIPFHYVLPITQQEYFDRVRMLVEGEFEREKNPTIRFLILHGLPLLPSDNPYVQFIEPNGFLREMSPEVIAYLCSNICSQNGSPRRKLTGKQIKQIQDAILDGYDPDSLRTMVRVHLDESLHNIASGDTFRRQVFTLIEWSEREDRVLKLVRSAHEANPNNQMLQSLWNDIQTWLSVPPEETVANADGLPRRGTLMSRVTVLLEGSISEFAGSERKSFILALSRIVGVPTTEIRVLHIAPGNSLVKLEMSEQAAKLLVSLYAADDPALQSLRISKVELQQTKGESTPTSVHKMVVNSGKTWAVLVGVNRYDDPYINDLKVCVADVTAIQQSLDKGDEVSKLLNDATAQRLPTRGNILGELSVVAQAAEEGDLLLFYFSGHGIAEAGESYLLPRDAHFSALKHTALGMREVRGIMDSSAARAKVIILDACHSGASIGKTETVMTEEFIRRVFEEAEGMVVLASCKQGQKSWEWPEQGRSVFTHYLLEALIGQADFDNKGFVTVSDVNRYVSDGVRRWAAEHGVPQTPTLQSSVAGDIVLVRYA